MYWLDESRDTRRDALDKLSVSEAASRLGVTQSAVRKRVQRGQIPYEKDERGHTFVYLSRDESRNGSRDEHAGPSRETTRDESRDAYVSALEDQVRDLRERLNRAEEANREHRRLLAAALERIPAIEAPRDEPGAPETARQDAGRVEDRPSAGEPQTGAQEHSTIVERPTEETARKPWWLRIFWG